MRSIFFFLAFVPLLFCLDVAETMSGDVKDSVYDVIDFGAVGDGMHDDSAAIQSAIDSASKAGGGTVLLPWPKAKYRLAKDIMLLGIILPTISNRPI